MKHCVFCGTDNDSSALFCTVCGKKLALPGSEHDFTSGVMRYVPEARMEAETLPVYLNQTAYASAATVNAVPQKQIPPAYTAVPQSGRSGKASVIVIGVIALLVLLIIVGIVFVLGGIV
ncbi:MAG: hypothetical protein IJQ21_02210 [Lachnospiraceae bacterium]|nr:hypothetical protein [Lachnospiraceae bacterium]